MKLKNKVTLFTSAIILFFGVLSTIFVFFQMQSILLNEKKLGLSQAAQEHGHEITTLFESSQNIVQTLSQQNDLLVYLSSVNPSLQDVEILSLLQRYNIAEMYSAIYVMDFSGTALTSTNESFVGKNYGFRPYFIDALEGEGAVNVLIGVTSKEPGYYFSHPVLNSSGEIVGVVVMKMKPEFIHNESLDILGVFEESHVMLIDENGVIVFSDEEDSIYKSLGSLTFSQKDVIKSESRFADIEINPLGYQVVQDSLENLEKTEVFEILDEYHGEEELIAITPIAHTPFSIVIEQEFSVVSLAAFRAAGFSSLLVIVAVIFTVLAISLSINRFLKPLSHLKDAALQAGKGKLNAFFEFDIESRDEIGELSHVFVNMIRELSQSQENIEKKIQERTHELEKLNITMTGRELKMIELKKVIKQLKKKINED